MELKFLFILTFLSFPFIIHAENNLLKLNEALFESWHVMKRAGAQFIITYGARKSKELGFSV